MKPIRVRRLLPLLSSPATVRRSVGLLRRIWTAKPGAPTAKGRRRANATVDALRAIGAKRTADLLAKAIAPAATAELRGRLDDRFDEVPEDLAILAMRHVGRTA